MCTSQNWQRSRYWQSQYVVVSRSANTSPEKPYQERPSLLFYLRKVQNEVSKYSTEEFIYFKQCRILYWWKNRCRGLDQICLTNTQRGKVQCKLTVVTTCTTNDISNCGTLLRTGIKYLMALTCNYYGPQHEATNNQPVIHSAVLWATRLLTKESHRVCWRCRKVWPQSTCPSVL